MSSGRRGGGGLQYREIEKLMAAPNDQNQPKKPTPTPPPGKTPLPGKGPAPVAKGVTPPARPAAAGKPPAPAGGKPAGDGKPVGEAKPPSDGKPAGDGKPAAEGKPAAPKPDGEGKAAQKPAQKPAAKRAAKSGASKGGGRRIGQVLVDLGFVDDDQLWDILEEAKNTSQFAGQVAVARGLITEEQLLQAMAEQNGLKVINLEEVKPQPEALTLVPETMASVYKILPISLKDKVLTIAIGDPNNLTALDDLRNLLNVSEVQALLAPAKAITDFMPRFYAGKEESIVDLINELENNPELGSRRAETSIDLEDVMEMAEAAPVRKLINMVFLLGIRDKSSDIHFEPFEDEYKIRMRCDGILYEMVPPPRHLASAISSRIKVMANLDIAERRLPQDGRIELNVGGHPVDMRVSVLPTMFG